jgi:hypothetical protein
LKPQARRVQPLSGLAYAEAGNSPSEGATPV